MPHLTPRWVLQYVGTELMRDGFHEDMWVGALQRRVMCSDADMVIADVRFPNEASAVRDAGGIIVRVTRPGAAHTLAHSTETALDDFQADRVILNDATLEELHAQVDAFDVYSLQ
jgi:hypothetical protein